MNSLNTFGDFIQEKLETLKISGDFEYHFLVDTLNMDGDFT